MKAARLLDVKTGAYVANPVVVVRGDRIESVGDDGRRPERRVIDLGDRTLLPGLIDAHTHILLQGDATAPEYDEQILKEYPAHRVARAVRALKIALEHGFTALRDLETEGASYDDVALRDAVNEGVIPGPAPEGRRSRALDDGQLPDHALPPRLGLPRRRPGLRRRRSAAARRCANSSPTAPTGSRSTPTPAACA